MLSFVLLPILRASITPLRTFHQRSLLLSDVNCASISEKYLPRFERGFFVDLLTKLRCVFTEEALLFASCATKLL